MLSSVCHVLKVLLIPAIILIAKLVQTVIILVLTNQVASCAQRAQSTLIKLFGANLVLSSPKRTKDAPNAPLGT